MPSASKQQQKLMGIVHALQKGDMKPSQASGKAKEMAKSMKKGDVKDFAATKHKGLPKKVKKENMGVASMYVVRKPNSGMNEADLVLELNPLEGIQPLNIMQDDVLDVVTDETEARRIAAEAYKSCMDEAFQLEEKKGKVGDKLKKTIDHLEKKRKEHIDMAKEDPKNASQHKEHIAKLATQIDDLMSKMERIEKSKKNVENKEDKESVKENKKSTYTIGDKIVGSNKVYFIYNNDTGTQSGSYKTKEEAQKELDKKNK
jgi:K+/H+ antiporter YhaU regulatory subunit KhtT